VLALQPRLRLDRLHHRLVVGADNQAVVEAVKAETGLKGKHLFKPLRAAITGRASGPELGALLPLMGQERALARIRAAKGG